MRIFSYLREISLSIVCVIVLVIITDLVLATSTVIGMGTKDVIYLNILLAAAAGIFCMLGYTRFCAKYLKLRQALDRKESIDYMLPEDISFYSLLLRDALQLKNDELAKSIAVYRNSMDELNDYIIKWVHEIKIPVSVCELILENTDTGSAHTSRSLKLELERMKFLISQVLYAGRAAHYNEDLSISEFNLLKLVRDAVKRNAAFFILKNIEITMEAQDFSIVNDEKWVSYILDQILNNASKYTGQDGRVQIYTLEDDKAIRLHIRDNGTGISMQDISRVFDKGFTGENGRKTTKSTGMGLYYSKKMADRLGIGLEVCSKAGEYTEFVIVFYKMRDYFKVT